MISDQLGDCELMIKKLQRGYADDCKSIRPQIDAVRKVMNAFMDLQ